MVLTSTHNLCFEQEYETFQNFLSENFHFLVVKFSVYMYLNKRIFVMQDGFTRDNFMTSCLFVCFLLLLFLFVCLFFVFFCLFFFVVFFAHKSFFLKRGLL